MQRVQGNRYVTRMLAPVDRPSTRPGIDGSTADSERSSAHAPGFGRRHAAGTSADQARDASRVPWYAANAPSSPTVQRDDDEDGGLLSSALSWVTSGWDSLKSEASGLIDGLRERVSSGLDGLRSMFEAISSQVGGAWEALKSGAQGLIEAAEQGGTGLLGGILGQLKAIGAALLDLDADRLSAAWSALTGAAGQAWSAVKGIATGALAQVRALWSGLQGLATGLIGGLGEQAASLLGGVPAAVQGIQDRVSGLWDSLAGQVSGVLRRLPGWSIIERGWSGLWSGIQSTASSVVQGAQSVWQGLQTRADTVWQGIQSGWTGTQEWVSKKAGSLVSGFERIAGSLGASAIGGLISTIRKLSDVFKLVRQAIQDPGSMLDPLAQEISGRLANLPEQARTDAQTKIQEAAGGGGGGQTATMGPSSGGASAAPASATPVMRIMRQPVQRAPRGTLGVWDVITGAWDHLAAKVTGLMGVIGGEIKKMLLSMVWPPATWEGLKEDWAHMTKELSTRWDRGSGVRTDSLGNFWEDLRRWVSNLVDYPLIIWRSVNAMLGRLSIYITVALIVGGAIGGAVAGAIAGAAAGGAGALPGAGAGFLAGGKAGLALSAKLGTGLLISFIAAEVASITKAVGDLLFVPQSTDEQEEDFNQIADSVIAGSIAGLLFFLTWVGTRIARSLANLARRIRARVKPKPKVVPPKPGPKEPKPDQPDLVVVPGKEALLKAIAGSKKFAANIRGLLDKIKRPGARPGLESRLQSLDDTLAQLEREAAAATTPEEVSRLKGLRDQAQKDLEALNKDIQKAIPRFPKSWDEFDERFHAEFEAELNRFRGNQDLEPTAGLRGGEGQLFLGGNSLQALKRWFKIRLGDMAESIRLLRAAKGSVEGNPKVRAEIEVVDVGRTGSDWALRGFEPDSIPLRNALGDPAAAGARARAIAALEGTADPVLQNILGKLQGNSANLHWSPGKGKIVIIDMQ